MWRLDISIWLLKYPVCLLCSCSVAQLCPTLYDPMNASTPVLPVPHHLLEFAQVHVHCISNAIQPSHPDALFSFCPQSFSALGTFPMSCLLASNDQKSGVSALALVLPANIQGWYPLRLTGLISLLSKGLSGVFSSTTVRGHQFFGVLPSLQSNSQDHVWPLERPSDLGDSSFGVISFWPFIQFMRFSQQVYWGGLPFLPPVDHVLSALSAMTHLSWVALHSMAHSFIDLCRPLCHEKAVICEGLSPVALRIYQHLCCFTCSLP